MHVLRILFVVTTWYVAFAAAPAGAQPSPLTLSSPQGAEITFVAEDGTWTWSRLKAPGGPADGWAVNEWGVEVATPERSDQLSAGWTLVEATLEKLVFEQTAPTSGLTLRRVFSFGPANNVLRVDVWAQSPDGKKILSQVGLLTTQFEGEPFRETGAGPASFPLLGETLFAGIEHISGEARALGEASDIAQLIQRPRTTVDEGWKPIVSAVIGWAAPGLGTGLTGAPRLREAFLHYLDTVRLKPERIVLHTDTWWTIPLPLSERSVLNDIDTLRKRFVERTGMFFDTYCVDLGWSDPRTFWRVDTQRFPTELRAINDQLSSLGGKLGLWLSPGSGYPEGLNNSWLQAQGYETTPFPGHLGQVPCFALGTRYQREFKERLVGYAQQYGLGHVILDFMAQRCDVPTHGHPVGVESRYAIDAGVADVLDSLRAVNPGIVLEPMVCGYPPSPWWLTKTPFILGPAGDDMPYGRVPCPDWIESLITARDIAYRASQESWIMPTQALETWDIILQTPGDFQNMAVMAVGRGRWFLSTYLKPDLMDAEDWDFLAAMVQWMRQNKQYLVNAWQFGGRPEAREAYGFMFRNPDKDLYCVRNPWIEEQTIDVPGLSLATEPRDIRMIYPRRATVARLQPGGRGFRFAVAPYETVLLETVPVGEAGPLQSEITPPQAGVIASPPQLNETPAPDGPDDINGFVYTWNGTLDLPDVSEPEVCILVTGSTQVSLASASLSVGGREVRLRKSTSVGQFAAATDASPENWCWYIGSLPKGMSEFDLRVTVPLGEPALGIYLRGSTEATNDPAPENGAVFPTFRAERRAWSQTLKPLEALTAPAR